jgi:hypothetical protein
MAAAAAGGFNWGNFASAGLGAVGNVVGGYLEGQGQKAGMQALAGANRDAARLGFMGSAMRLSDEQAARAGQYAQNVFGQLGGSLYNAPIDYAWQRRGKEEDLGFKARQFAMAREENRLGEEELQTPLFKRSREAEATENRLAGKYAVTLPLMAQWGRFNLQTT